MPRVTKADLERENAELKAELVQRRERSRSRRRKVQFVAAPMDATTRRALDIVRKHDRDGVIEEQRATIARQAQEMAAVLAKHAAEKKALEEGAGRIGPVILKAWGDYVLMPFSVEKILSNQETVLSFITRMKGVMSALDREFTWGPHFGRVRTERHEY
jgi:hypothetical protein